MVMRLVAASAPGERNAPRGENVLHLAVLAERPVHGEEGEVGAGGHLEVSLVVDDNLGHVVADLAQRAGAGRAGAQGHFALGGGPAHQYGDPVG